MTKVFRIVGDVDNVYIQSGSAPSTNSTAPLVITGYGGTPELMRVNDNGWVGIGGTGAPPNLAGPLHVKSGATDVFIVNADGTINFLNKQVIVYNGLSVFSETINLATSAEVAVPASTSGWGTIQASNNTYNATFTWSNVGTVQLQFNSDLVTNDNTGAGITIYNKTPNLPNQIGIKNRTAGLITFHLDLRYS